MTETTTQTLEVPGAVLAYDVRRNESSTEPVLLLIGSPMGAAGSESAGEMANRGAFAVAERLSTKPIIFPSHHGGFLGGEHG